jgi:hypothetical protein
MIRRTPTEAAAGRLRRGLTANWEVRVGFDRLIVLDYLQHRGHLPEPARAGLRAPGGRGLEPDQARHEEYRFHLDRYRETYPRMKDLLRETTRHLADG